MQTLSVRQIVIIYSSLQTTSMQMQKNQQNLLLLSSGNWNWKYLLFHKNSNVMLCSGKERTVQNDYMLTYGVVMKEAHRHTK